MKAETDQFFDGLDVLGVMSMVRKYPDLMKPLFVPENVPLTKGNHYHTKLTPFYASEMFYVQGYIKRLLIPKFSPCDTSPNERTKEEATYMFLMISWNSVKVFHD